jgi:hypothetical protein
MNCFNHRDVPAIGLCKSCLKGLCGDCAAELVNGLACKGSCEERANMINRMVDSNSRIVGAARRQTQTSTMFSLLMGIGFSVFAVWAYIEFKSGSFLPYLLGLMGIIMLVTGFLRLSRAQQYPQLDDEKK